MKVRISFELEFDENGDAADYGSKGDIIDEICNELPNDFLFITHDMIRDSKMSGFIVEEL